MQALFHRSYFFDEGIRFRCLRCGRCCTGGPGVVEVNAAEIGRIARLLAVPAADLSARWPCGGPGGRRVPELPDGRCLFFDGGCTIYPARPAQCRTFPFWTRNLRSRERWDRTAAECPGVGRGELHSKERILDILSAEAFE